jgi:hypothetical protein
VRQSVLDGGLLFFPCHLSGDCPDIREDARACTASRRGQANGLLAPPRRPPRRASGAYGAPSALPPAGVACPAPAISRGAAGVPWGEGRERRTIGRHLPLKLRAESLAPMSCPTCKTSNLMRWTTLAPKVGFEKSFWHQRLPCTSDQRSPSPAAKGRATRRLWRPELMVL